MPRRNRLPHWPIASLRAYLVLVTLVATVPLALFSFYLLQRQATAERAEANQAVQRASRAFSLLVERELASSTDLLTGLAYNDALQRGDTATFHRQLQRSAPPRPGWLGVYLAEPDGHIIFASDQPYGSDLGRLRDVAALERIRSTLLPSVTDLVSIAPGGQLATGVQVPVIVRGRLQYVLGARIAASHWQQLVERASIAPGGFVLLVDRSSRVIAHNMDPRRIGHVLPLDKLVQALAERRLPLLDLPPFAAREAVPSTGWTVGAAVPSAPLLGTQAGALASVLAAGALSLLLGIALALVVARRVSAPLRQLAGGGAGAVREPVVVREIAALRAALQIAGEQNEAAHLALRRKADEFEALLSSSPVGLAMTLDGAGTRALINPALASMLGAESGVQDLRALLDAPPTAPALRLRRDGRALALAEQPMQRAARHGDAVDEELELLHPDGQRIDLEVRAVPLRDPTGAPRGAVAAFVDVTARRLAEQQRAQLMRAEQEARRAAEDANRGKDEFLAMLGHELRNPLGAIGAAVEVLNRTEGQGDVAASARRVIGRQTKQMAQLMNDLQDVARAAAGKITLERRRLDLARLVWRPLDALRVAGQFRRHALSLQLAPAWIDADPVRLEQVVVNLLNNATKYTPAGGWIELVVRSDASNATLEVRDSGFGIAESVLPHVFDPFVQGERTAARRQGGMGLGLALVRRLSELHGGEVQAASEGPNRGCTFTLRLPLAAAQTGPAPATPCAGLHGLVVAPGDATPLTTEQALADAGCRVTTTGDPDIALERLGAARVDFVLLDVALRSADALLRALDASGRTTPLLALVDDRAAAPPGVDAVLERPLDPDVLRRHLDSIRRGALAT